MTRRPEQTSAILLTYQANIRNQLLLIRQRKRTKNGLAVARLIVVLLAVGLMYHFWPAVGLSLISFVVCVAGLAVLVLADAGKTEQIKNHERLIKINQHEIDILEHRLAGYEEGSEFASPMHAYASDLDLFGSFSLYQFLNRCHAHQSKKLLADHLLNPLPLKLINEKQEAAKEISKKPEWSQQFQSNAMANPISFQTEKRLMQWMQEPPGIFEKSYWKAVVVLYAMVSLTTLTLFIVDLLTLPGFLLFLICFFSISSFISSKIQPTWVLLSRIEPEMNALYEQIRALEEESFEASFLRNLKIQIRGTDQVAGVAAIIRQFRGILKRFDYRLNLMVSVFLNGFLLWDLQQMIALITWKKRNKNLLAPWFSAIAETEVVISLASLTRNEPGWCFPKINNDYFNLSLKDLGHPLIPAEKNVLNSFQMVGRGKIVMVTGSNMAGKSTFLRSLGTNLTLAFMGAPVCASFLEASHMHLLSSMRVADNLAENTSTFHAELKKLQSIIERVNRNEPVFILLDEVLRGTNSEDRHAGTKALIRQLIRQNAVAVIATHDTGLAITESDHNPEAISNYHFDGQIRGEELFFDYQLRTGVCESLNATLLMKKIGIHFED
ncbi:MAG: hypothetical protein Q8918_09620 [Bacteroidota bacterium]|nr:hypothetical protein [Bacteroidota bacterium]MDP4250350.1 hypothetical protein [Bacteroidota bacterium]